METAMRRELSACHWTLPLAPDGRRAERDCLRYGRTVGKTCLVSRWALILACALAGHSIPAMSGATGISWARRNAARPNQLLLCACIAALALSCAVAPHV